MSTPTATPAAVSIGEELVPITVNGRTVRAHRKVVAGSEKYDVKAGYMAQKWKAKVTSPEAVENYRRRLLSYVEGARADVVETAARAYATGVQAAVGKYESAVRGAGKKWLEGYIRWLTGY
jgi:hypothetical protein